RLVQLVERTLPGGSRSVAGVSRACVSRHLWYVRVPDEAAGRVAARSWRLYEPVQRVSLLARTGDAAVADGSPHRKRARGCAVFAAASGGRERALPRAARESVRAAGKEIPAARSRR